MRLLLIAAFILISGCVSTQKVANRIYAEYNGQNFDSFVRERGLPHSRYQLSDGGNVYVWNSGVITYRMPSTTTVSGTVDSSGYYAGCGVTTGGGNLNVFCEVQIETDRNNIIRAVTITRDTIGKWTTSRCGEVFK